MQIKKRLFSYPILNNDETISTYKNERIELVFDTEETDDYYILKNVHYLCESPYLLSKIDEEDIIVKCIIECPSTIYKTSYVLSREGQDISLLKNDLSNKVEISLVAFAKNDFVMESSEEFDEDYQDINYNILKTQILGFDDGFSVPIYHQESTDNLAHSIFSIIRNEMSESMFYEISIKSNKIEISLSPQLYDKYLKVHSIDSFAEEFFCALLVPSLAEGLHSCLEVAKDAADVEFISEKYNWFNSITDAYKRLHGDVFTLDEFKEMNMNNLAQELLGSPLSRALEEINVKVGLGDDLDE